MARALHRPSSTRGFSKRTSDDVDNFKPLTLTRGAAGPPAMYEYSMAAGDSSSPVYATASGAEAAEGATYVLANGDVGATGAPAEYFLANGDVAGDPEYAFADGNDHGGGQQDPTYDVATEDDGYLAVLPGVSDTDGTGVQENAYDMVPPGVRSSSVSGGRPPQQPKQKVVQIYGSDHDSDEDDGGDDDGRQVVSSEGMVLQATEFV